jgi:hypothetical protein
MNLVTMAPLGYATYLVYKYGGGKRRLGTQGIQVVRLGYLWISLISTSTPSLGFDHRDTTIALGLYGGMALLDLSTCPVIESRNYKSVCRPSFSGNIIC